jgi:hypothetical protein
VEGGGIGVSDIESRRWGGGTQEDCKAALARSAAVSVATQKKGGELTQPMGRTRGKATSGVSPRAGGRRTPNLGMSRGKSQMR